VIASSTVYEYRSKYSNYYSSGYTPAIHSFPTRRSSDLNRPTRHERRFRADARGIRRHRPAAGPRRPRDDRGRHRLSGRDRADRRSEEHTSELQSRFDLVCRLLLEKKKIVGSQLFAGNIL